ncbi:hypothetical protein Tco_0509906, partial [Tanacetum coccineum]
VTSEGTGLKLGVPDVTKDDLTESESESWGNDEDDKNDESDAASEHSDEENESDEDETQSDNEEGSDSEHDTEENDTEENSPFSTFHSLQTKLKTKSQLNIS